MTGTLRYEWRRISTVRSTWLLIVLGILVPAGFALLVAWLASISDGQGGGPPNDGSASGLAAFLPLSAAILCTIGAAAFGQEYRHELIRVTLAVFPRRTPVFLAKLAMVILVIAVTAAVAIAAVVVAEYIGGVIAATSTGWNTDVLGSTGILGLLYVVTFVLIAFAITALTRNQPLGIIAPIVLMFLVEPIVGLIAMSQFWTWIDWVLPFSGGQAALVVGGAEAWGHMAVFFGWFLVLAIPAWILFLRRDA
jgi:ABC-type transport system involved in multi-copper enzyme maturation permease subunit